MTESNTAFLRRYSLTVGNSKDVKDSITTKDDIQLTTDFTTEVIGSLNINSLKMKATIQAGKGSSSPSVGASFVELYNIDDKDLGFFIKDNTLLLKAGYESIHGTDDTSLPLIYAGQISKVTTEKKGSDFVTKIVCGDSIFARNNLRVAGAVPKGTAYIDAIKILLDILKAKGVPVQNMDIYKDQADRLFSKLPNGYSFEGSLVASLNKLVAGINYRTYFHLGKLHIEPVEDPFFVDAVLLKATNIKDSIAPESSTSGKSSGDKDSKEGIVLNTFLNGEITLNKALLIQDIPKFTGKYKITALEHLLDTEGEKWDTKISCRRI